ncbi:unnamed protein product [Clonostachys rosea f. rosea IK726]|uniref:Amino acid permease/ SLC12A domain-containing protein n=2 Tax=Bionectria ochroleuca TaxID=29856 RepID=A0A0B7KGZ2_BIOOC|nr:unnamed protein product [Clonostachys rosea f. rosea IK726]
MPSDKKDDESLRKTGSNKFGDVSAGVVMDEVSHAGGLHRVLGNRQIQLLSAGGAIGTGLFISIGAALAKGGPANLFIAFSLFSSVLTCINNSMAEMTTHMPVAGGFVRLAGYWALAIPFEITAMTFVSSFWSERVTDPGPTAGNTYCFCACRVLHGLALEGRAPRILARTTKSGTPIYAFGVVLCFACLSFLQVSSGTATVLSWMTSLITGGGQINYIVMTVTFLRYHKACNVQGVDRKTRPYYGRLEPYSTCLAIGMQIFIYLSLGYTSFLPWDVGSFFASYTMQILMPVLFIAWKLYHKTRMVPAADVDVIWERPLIDAYEAAETEIPTGFWAEMGSLIGFRKDKQSSLEAPTPSSI